MYTLIRIYNVIVNVLIGNFSCFFVVSWFFSVSTCSKNSLRNTIWVSNRLNLISNCIDAKFFMLFCCQLIFFSINLFRNTIWVSNRLNLISNCIDVKFFMLFCCLLIFFKINFFEKKNQKYHLSVKQIGSRSGPTYCQAWSRSNLFSKYISRRH